MANTSVLGNIAQNPDDDTLARLLATYQQPAVVSGGGPLGSIQQAKLAPSPFATQQDDQFSVPAFAAQAPVAAPAQNSILGSIPDLNGSQIGLVNAKSDLMKAQDKLQADAPKPYDYKQHGVLGNIGHVFGRIGNIAGDILDPNATSLIPGSDLFNERRTALDQANVDKEKSNVFNSQREADSVDNETKNRDFEQQKWDQGSGQRDAELNRTNSQIDLARQQVSDLKLNNQPNTPEQAKNLQDIYGPIMKNAGITGSPFYPGQSPTDVQRTITSLEHLSDQFDKNRNFNLAQTNSVNEHNEHEEGLRDARNASAATRADAASEREADKGKALISKAETSYNTSSAAADDLQMMVDGAKAGNKIFSAAAPLEGALAINTSQGVKRINRTEVDQIAGAGSLYDKLQGEMNKLKSGQSIPTGVLDDYQKLSNLLRNSAYKTYSDNFDSAKGLYGGNATKRSAPSSYTEHYTVNGQGYDIPADKVDAFKNKFKDAKKGY